MIPLRVILTGAGGVVGGALLARLAAAVPASAEICLIARSEASAREQAAVAGAAGFRQVRTICADLTDAAQMSAAHASLPRAARALVAHCAADVSWAKSAAALTPVNVDGTLRLAELLVRSSERPHFLFVSSAYTQMEAWTYRNGYEATKAEAERQLRARFPGLETSTFSCSLVVGDAGTGEISRFHGLYPLVKLLATGEPPFVVGRADCLIDIVPRDWVADELAAAVADALEGRGRDVVAAAGAGRVRLSRMFEIIADEINAARRRLGAPEQAPLPLISHRRWAFLRRSLDAWRPGGFSPRQLRNIEFLLDIYEPYTASDTVRAPQGVRCDGPRSEDVLPGAVRYWLEAHEGLLRRRWVPSLEDAL